MYLLNVYFSCPRYPPLPANCRMVSDPANPCCKRPDCSNPTPVPGPNNTPNPNPTLAPKIGKPFLLPVTFFKY